MLRHLTYLFLLSIISLNIIGQSIRDSISDLSIHLTEESRYQKKQELNKALKEKITLFAIKDPNFKQLLNQVEGLSILYPKDSTFRLINWNVAYSDGTYSYECGVQKRGAEKITFLHPRKEAVPTNFLFTNEDEENALANATATKEDWIGALYYDIIQTQGKFNTYYTLLGWDGNDLLTNKKIIDVLWFTKANEIKFGAPIFKSNSGIKSRIIYEFGGQNSMRLYKLKAFERIILDHLSPPPANTKETTQLVGIYDYYGADLSFDALDWENDSWVLKSNINPEETDPKKLDDNPSLKDAPSQKDFIDQKNAKKVREEILVYPTSKP